MDIKVTYKLIIRKMFYTCAKELGLLNIVHSVLDKNTLEINTGGDIKCYFFLSTNIMEPLSSIHCFTMLDWLIFVKPYRNLPSTYLVIHLQNSSSGKQGVYP